MREILLPFIFLMIAASSDGQEPTTIPLTLPDGKIFQVEVARTPIERTRGLMFRTNLSEDRGMLFIFDRPDKNLFWMKTTLIPLDILWMDSKKRIIHIESQVPPCKLDPCPVYGPTADSLYVLEANAGFAQKRGIKIGMTLRF